jgi:MYXO-CTERM domain-containing protein
MRRFLGIFLFWAGCASRDELGIASQPIVGGTLAPTRTNVVLTIRSEGSAGVTVCNATVIAPNLVLTARTCVAPVSSMTLTCSLSFGATFDAKQFKVAQDFASASSAVTVKEIIVPTSNKLCEADLALLVLDTALSATPAIPGLTGTVKKGDTFTAVGFGGTSAMDMMSMPTRRERANIPVQCADETCGAPYEFTSGEAGCNGDSGAPAFGADGSLIGIVARGDAICTATTWAGIAPHAAWLRSEARRVANPVPSWAADGDASPITDSAPATDTGTANAAAPSESGCGCRTSPTSSSGALVALALLGLAAARRQSEDRRKNR